MKYAIIKVAAVLGVAATMMASVADPAAARDRWVGPAIGFAAGVAVGSAIANSNRGYYSSDRYYGYDSYDAYAYDPNYGRRVYVQPSYPQYYQPYRKCNSDSNAGRQDQGC